MLYFFKIWLCTLFCYFPPSQYFLFCFVQHMDILGELAQILFCIYRLVGSLYLSGSWLFQSLIFAWTWTLIHSILLSNISLRKTRFFFYWLLKAKDEVRHLYQFDYLKKKIRVQFPPLNVIHHQNLLTAKSRVLPRFSVISSPYTLLPNQSLYGFRHLKELGDIRIFFLLFFYWLLIDRRI